MTEKKDCCSNVKKLEEKKKRNAENKWNNSKNKKLKV